MTDTPKCLTCGADLVERPGAKSKRPGETLFVCTGPKSHKNQGKITEGGYWHIYQTGRDGYDNREHVNIRLRRSEQARIMAVFGSIQKWIDEKYRIDNLGNVI